MKRFLISTFLILCSSLCLLAVPKGMYSDDRGRNKVFVADNGDIHFVDSEGNITKTLSVIKENPDGSFTTRDNSTGIIRSDNCYWYEDGVLYMNLAQKRTTLHRE